MKSIEDCLEKLESYLTPFSFSPSPQAQHAQAVVSEWDQKFIGSVAKHTRTGSPLSTAQAATVVKVIAKYVDLFGDFDIPLVENLIQFPKYRKELHQSVQVKREVRWAGGPNLLFRFSFNQGITDSLRALRSELADLTRALPVKNMKMWRVTLDSTNYKEVMRVIQAHDFSYDDDVLKLFLEIENNLKVPSSISVEGDEIVVSINNDILATEWIAHMEWLRDV